ncbi:HlyD family type I secretion periplasmic adaptor subunit [Parvularcula sp. ZS-1/3]|uniref:Membrane fusion protein (MFP) family protein n=1 Tax=Parvularcula mediterranea TaxID=2732508 RepID=A0A7Y3RQ04_9PROT|nr:HlyD family type I secretion periplasmic adaptor subunit [Parvularcula mediterranea]
MPADLLNSTDQTIRRAGTVCLVGLGGFLLWAGLAPLSEGVSTFGSLVVEDNRKVVQHLEGGIVRAVNVREGDLVAAGDVLVEFDRIAAEASRDEVAQELFGLLAGLDRLDSLTRGIEAVAFTEPSYLAINPGTADEIRARQQELFEQQRETHLTEIGVLEAQRETLLSSRGARDRQLASTRRALRASNEELALKRDLLTRKLVQVDEVSRLERENANLEGDVSRLQADRAESASAVVEIEQKIRQTRAAFLEKLSTERAELRRQAFVAEERFAAADDILNRTQVVAPQSGAVMNLAFTTLGGVVSAGEPIMEIVPDEASLVAKVQINPSDRDSVQEGMVAVSRLSAYKSWKAPSMTGRVVKVSADLKTDQVTGATYYEATLHLEPEGDISEGDLQFIPGMPVEAFIDSGFDRTFLDYLLEPITTTFRRGL